MNKIIEFLLMIVFWIIVFTIYPKIKRISKKVFSWISPKLTPHLKKISFFTTFLITMSIAITLSFYLIETINIPLYSKIWPYQMTVLTFLLGYETYRMYKRQYPNPTNYTLQQSLKNHHLNEGDAHE
jgi:hypothetical protein